MSIESFKYIACRSKAHFPDNLVFADANEPAFGIPFYVIGNVSRVYRRCRCLVSGSWGRVRMSGKHVFHCFTLTVLL